MTQPPIVQIRNVTLEYVLRRRQATSLKEYVVGLPGRAKAQVERIRALDNVSLSVGRGEICGIVGRNGAGKSTLMKVVSRILHPTQGRVIVHGRMAPMIELGAGFNVELTAAENIVLYGSLLGRDPRGMRERIPEIARWAELEEFVDVPLRSYSTGMLARLGFAVATDDVPDLLVVDEVLSVGDERFREKSLARIRSRVEQGTSLLLVSHALDTVSGMADRVVWLERGAVKEIGDAKRVVDLYRRFT